MTFSIPITGSFFCHNCHNITWGVQGDTCECGCLLISAQEMFEHHVIRARELLAKNGVKKGTPVKQRTQRASDINQHLTAFLTAREAA